MRYSRPGERFLSIGTLIFAAAATLLLSAPMAQAQATNIYLAQSGVGTANGVDCADAYAYSFFNSAGNWGSGAGQIGPGTTVHVCGTITGSANSTLLTFQGSGTSGSPVTLLFETGAILQAPYLSTSTGGINVNGRSYITIDGGSNGIIQNTDNGVASLGYSNQQPSRAFLLQNVHNVTVRNLTIQNLCMVTASSATACNGTDTAFWIDTASNITITRNTLHDTNTGIWYIARPGDTAFTLSNNTFYNIPTGFQPGWGGGAGTVSNMVVSGNDFSCPVTCPWNGTGIHKDMIHFYVASAGAVYSGTLIYNNYFHDLDSTVSTTGFLNIEFPNGASMTGTVVFNNIFARLGSVPYEMSDAVEAQVYNNTFVGPSGTAIGWIKSNATFQNNIFLNNGYNLGVLAGATGLVSSYNDYYNWGQYQGWATAGGTYSSFASWQANSGSVCSGGCDTIGSITTDPNLNANYVPNSGSPVIGAGTNLTSLGIAALNQGAPQYFGVNYACGTGCVARPATGPWDMGAYPDPPTTTGGTPPTPPNALAAVVQ